MRTNLNYGKTTCVGVINILRSPPNFTSKKNLLKLPARSERRRSTMLPSSCLSMRDLHFPYTNPVLSILQSSLSLQGGYTILTTGIFLHHPVILINIDKQLTNIDKQLTHNHTCTPSPSSLLLRLSSSPPSPSVRHHHHHHHCHIFFSLLNRS